MTTKVPDYLLTIPQIVDKYCPQLIAWAQKTKGVKSDGALDEIPLQDEKRTINVKDLYINTLTQRVDAIEHVNIQDNLKKFGGFSHKTSGTIDTFVSKLYGDSSPDGMHRAIMAYICGVEQIAIQRQGEHPEGCSESEMIDAERDFFYAKNELNAKVKTTSKMRVAKLSGSMTKEQQELDNACAEVGIHVNDYGVSEDSAELVYKDGHGNMTNLLTNAKSSVYLGVDKFIKYIPLLKQLNTGRTQLDGAIANVCDMLGDESVNFKKYLKSEQYKTRHKDWWTAKCQHGSGMETATIRLALCFNEWSRAKFNEDVVTFDMFGSFIEGMNDETIHFIHSCLIDGNPVDKVLLDFTPETDSVIEECMV
jgi:hypothetical protein